MKHAQPTVYHLALLALIAGAALSAGCATSGNPKDPLEGYNRAMFAFNEGLDKVVIKPVAQGYDRAVPLPGKTAVSNFFSNLVDPWIAVNNLVQGKPGDALSDVGRFLINSTVGILGAFDIASEMGLEKHDEDFGQTLGRWGVGDGAYIVLPVVGSRTVRDTFGFAVDSYADPVWNYHNVAARNSLGALRFESIRAQLLPADKTVEEAALDKYVYIRDAYLQRRRYLIYDGRPPQEKDGGSALDPGSRFTGELDPVADAARLVFVTAREPIAPEVVRSQGLNDSASSGVIRSGAAAMPSVSE